MKEILSRATEAELLAISHNAKEAVPLRHTLIELGHDQPPTPIITDNSTACGIANDTVKQRRSRAMDMHAFLLGPGSRPPGPIPRLLETRTENLADYFTKHHPLVHHANMRYQYLKAPEDAPSTTPNMVLPTTTMHQPLAQREQADSPKVLAHLWAPFIPLSTVIIRNRQRHGVLILCGPSIDRVHHSHPKRLLPGDRPQPHHR